MAGQHRSNGRFDPRILTFFFLIISVYATGCASMSYMAQATRGQMELWNKARPISEVVQDQRVAKETRDILSRVPEIRRRLILLGLNETQSYRRYVDLKRPAVTWIVSASHPLKFSAKKFHFPIVGSFTYIGFFDRDRAQEYSQEIQSESSATEPWEADVRGARAYSTLGWFSDPLLSTMISEGPEALGELAHLLIHESVHATAYIAGQSEWNESLAEFFADQTISEVLGALVGKDSKEWLAFFLEQEKDRERMKGFHEAYQKLDQLYSSSVSDSEKLIIKGKIYDQLRSKYKIARPLNNASLIQFKTYQSASPLFEKLWNHCFKRSDRFMNAVKTIQPEWFENEQTEDFSSVLDRLLRVGC